MPEKTEAQKRAQKSYMGKFARVELRIEPERRDAIKEAAGSAGESVNTYINKAVDQRMERDNSPQGGDKPQA